MANYVCMWIKKTSRINVGIFSSIALGAKGRESSKDIGSLAYQCIRFTAGLKLSLLTAYILNPTSLVTLLIICSPGPQSRIASANANFQFCWPSSLSQSLLRQCSPCKNAYCFPIVSWGKHQLNYIIGHCLESYYPLQAISLINISQAIYWILVKRLLSFVTNLRLGFRKSKYAVLALYWKLCKTIKVRDIKWIRIPCAGQMCQTATKGLKHALLQFVRHV